MESVAVICIRSCSGPIFSLTKKRCGCIARTPTFGNRYSRGRFRESPLRIGSKPLQIAARRFSNRRILGVEAPQKIGEVRFLNLREDKPHHHKLSGTAPNRRSRRE